jgi:Ran GTPase-activating protein (RanGAP) involved in mRNA processing and transport
MRAESVRSAAERVRRGATVVELLGQGLGGEDVRPLATALARGRTVEVLDVSFNPLADAGARALAAGLEHSSLRKLRLCFCQISASGTQALATGLARCGLLELDLQGNSIGDDGARALAAALAGLPALMKLDLSFCEVRDPGAHALAAALTCNATLRKLKLQLNRIGDDGARALAEALQANHTLISCGLVGNRAAFELEGLVDDRVRANCLALSVPAWADAALERVLPLITAARRVEPAAALPAQFLAPLAVLAFGLELVPLREWKTRSGRANAWHRVLPLAIVALVERIAVIEAEFDLRCIFRPVRVTSGGWFSFGSFLRDQ